ncbi:MAG: hypothetical protein H7210_03485, partial [Pyrinomonadaceae bacterium]|nr:hypothetical protein [Phycisphaerales bacterium]
WPLGTTSTLVRTTTCTLESLTPELAKITAKGQAKIQKKEAQLEEPQARPRRGARQPDTTLEPQVLITEQADTSTVEWNPADGVLLSRVRESSMTTKAQLGTHEGEPQQVRSRIEVRLKRD